MVEKEIEIGSGGNKLAGVVCLPKDDRRFPVVLMVHGSGPLDRNENMRGQKLDVFNAIAHHLADAGIGSLRYDKRGCGKSGGNYYAAGHFDHVEDASRCIGYLEQSDFAMRNGIFALGHSEGSIIAPQLSLRHPGIAGIILLSPFLEPIESMLMRQAEHIRDSMPELKGITGMAVRAFLRDPVKSQENLITRIKSSQASTLRNGFEKIAAKWLRELIGLNPQAIISRVTCPMLLIGGGKDVQCDPGDVERIAKLTNGEAEAHVLPDLTHILRCDFEKNRPSIFRYKELLKNPVERSVLELIGNWLKRRADALRNG